MGRRIPESSVSDSNVEQMAIEDALQTAITAREKVFALENDELLLLADALVIGIARAVGHNYRHQPNLSYSTVRT